MLLAAALWYTSSHIYLECYCPSSSRFPSALVFRAAFCRTRVLASNDFVLTSFLKKSKPKPAPAFLSRSGNQASASFPHISVGRTRESYFLNTHFLSTLPLTAWKSDVWTYQRGEVTPQLQLPAGHGMMWQTLPQRTCGYEEV